MALNINGTTGISGVDGSVSAPAVTGTDSNTGITFPSADTIKFSTGGVERMQITNSGVSGTGIGAGKILQIVQVEHTSSAQSTSGTYADTGLTASITTSSSGHAGVFVIANLAMGAQAANGGDAYVIFNIVRDSTQVKQGMVGKFEDNLSGHVHVGYWQPAMNFYDTGTSASTTYTYKCQYAKKSDATAAFYNNSNQYGSSIVLLEVGT